MKKVLLLLLAGCCLGWPVFAQVNPPGGVISGLVSDSVSAAPLGYVTIGLREPGKTNALKSTYTKENGRFEFAGLAFQPYEVIISYVGFQQKTILISDLSAAKPTVTLPQIKLAPTTSQLNEVEISTQKILVTQDIDKISYDVEADPESKSNSVLDMLRKVPLVTVDADDNIQLKGSTNYKVLINGKTSALFARNPKDVLKSMPAGSIRKIEVITNPPAKYEAEGVGGIINIITTKNLPGGYNGSVNGSARTPKGYNAGAFLTVKTGKFGFSGSYGNNAWYPPNFQNNFIRTDLVHHTTLTQTGSGGNFGRHQYSDAQLSFELDSLNLFTANFSIYKGANDINNEQLVSQETGGELLQRFRRQNESEEDWRGNDIGLDYQHTFRKNEEQVLTLSYKYSVNANGNFTGFTYQPVFNYDALTGKTQNDSREREHTWQADYVQPFGKQQLEIGAKTISRLNASTYYYAVLEEGAGNYVKDPNQTNDFDYTQDVYAGYTSLSLKHKEWGYKLGARLEETKINAAFKSSGTFAKQDYFNLIPSVAISRKLKEGQDLKLSYTQRLERPGLWYLNPYIDRSDPKNISYGNPNLHAATSHSFELAHSAFIKENSFNSSLYYSLSNNAIQQFTNVYPDSAVTTYGNIGKQEAWGLSVSSNLNLSKKLIVNVNTSMSYILLSGFVSGKQLRNTGVAGSVFGFASYKFEKNWKVSTNAGYYTREVMLQGRAGGYFYNSFSVNKTFLKNDKATIGITLNSPFQKSRRWKNELSDQTFAQVQESVFQMRRIGISFNYKFGKLKGDIARKKRGIENDDVKGGKSSGGG